MIAERIVNLLLSESEEDMDINDFMRDPDIQLGGRSKVQVKIEAKPEWQTPKLKALVQALETYNCYRRDHAAQLVRQYGFDAYAGGSHVAAISPFTGQRLLLITNPNDPDWN